MAIINKLENIASVIYDGSTINSNAADTILLLAPTIEKSVDKLTAGIGDTLTYTVTITNLGLSAINSLPFTDVLPAGSTYVSNSFKVNDVAETPTITANTLTYTIPTIAPLGAANIQFQAEAVGGII
ncbi:DUF11 domain-containing protein [Hydrogenoanaerobacterium sp.]|uniref:DUF11 domain-containing protein n=1 Tax=Hydrogenoanaerobacterium sp. TaxID=2953763 RepID=UPI00289B80F2|nr:DUF11 domain-containing protein [Hydrogenoanaerobacterium sp.]